jgi:hypothetical protein
MVIAGGGGKVQADLIFLGARGGVGVRLAVSLGS